MKRTSIIQQTTLLFFIFWVTISSSVMAEVVVNMLHIETDTKAREIWQGIANDFEAANPGVKINFEYVENEQFKKDLPKRLAGPNPPDLFYSWGGVNFRDKAKKGLLRDISERTREFKRQLYRNGIKAFTYKGKLYGAPYLMSQVGFWYNRELFNKAGVSTANIRNWDDFLDAIKRIKQAGVTPIALGAADKWPAHFYWSYLAMRAGGPVPFFNVIERSGKQFSHAAFVKAGKEFQRLVTLEPFQEGYETAGYGDSAKTFGNHQAAIHLMGDWDYNFQRQQSETGKGVEDKHLGWFAFPTLKGGSGTQLDSLGGINGFVASYKASDEAIEWLSFFLSYKSQARLASIDQIIPSARRAGFHLKNPFKKYIFENIHLTEWHQTFLDQEFGSVVGGKINDMSFELLTGSTTPEQAALTIQRSWNEMK